MQFISTIGKNGNLLIVLIIFVIGVQYSNIGLTQEALKTEIEHSDPLELDVADSNIIPQRAFQKWEHTFPCFIGDEDFVNPNGAGEKLRGLIYIKVPKTASSTLAGINLRIAIENTPNKTASLTNKGEGFYRVRCAETHRHVRARLLDVSNRNKKYTFLWTFVRSPTSQFLSQFFHFSVSRKGRSPNHESLMHYVGKQFTTTNYPQLNFVITRSFKKSKDGMSIDGDVNQIVQTILNDYDFIGVTERFDESLVALRLLLGLNAGDILHLPSKVGGEYDDGAYGNKCVRIMPKVTTRSMDKYLSSAEWHNRNEITFLLHKAANKSLDLTIQNIGQDEFNEALAEHKYLMSLINDRCASKAIFPCSKDGKRQVNKSEYDCYFMDSGCGHPCINQVYAEQVKAGKTQHIVKSVHNSFEGGDCPSKRESLKMKIDSRGRGQF